MPQELWWIRMRCNPDFLHELHIIEHSFLELRHLCQTGTPIRFICVVRTLELFVVLLVLVFAINFVL